MQEVAETEAGQNGHVDFRSHERAPGKSPSLFHAADEERQRCRQDHIDPFMQWLRSHRARGACINRRDRAYARIGRNHNRPDCSHDHDKQHRAFGLSKPKQRQGHPTDARQRL